MIRELAWRAIARIATIPAVTDWLIERAKRTPYRHIHGPDGSRYMGRWWLFNPYPYEGEPDTRPRWRRALPSVRVHHICRPDSDRALHDHPWNARTIILRGWYCELKQHRYPTGVTGEVLRLNGRGDTNRLLFGEYHRISNVPVDGVWTLFITWKKQGTWGFLVDGKKVPWREYLNVERA